MKLLYALTALLALSSPSLADHPMPPVPEGGVKVLLQVKCQDAKTLAKGQCSLVQDKAGNYYTIFFQGGEVMFIRRKTETGYEELWMSHAFQGV